MMARMVMARPRPILLSVVFGHAIVVLYVV